jgi:hypothetical protein
MNAMTDSRIHAVHVLIRLRRLEPGEPARAIPERRAV